MILYSLAFVSFFLCWVIVPYALYVKLLTCAAFLILMKDKYMVKLERIHLLLILFLAWIALGSFLSEYPTQSFLGFHLRGEGLITYVVMFALAWFYWLTFKTYHAMTGLCALILFITITLFMLLTDENFQLAAFTPVAIGSICAVFAVLLWSIEPLMVLCIMPFIAFSGCRSAFLAVLCSICLFVGLKLGFKKLLPYACGLMVVLGLIACFSPIRTKLASMDIGKMGFGARTGWILQADKLNEALPLQGFGIDTLHHYLKPVGDSNKAARSSDRSICDRSHNIMFDIILQTGWIGFYIFLLIASLCIWTTLNNRSVQNILCLSVLFGWFIFGLLNPQGVYSTFLAFWSVFGIRENDK